MPQQQYTAKEVETRIWLEGDTITDAVGDIYEYFIAPKRTPREGWVLGETHAERAAEFNRNPSFDYIGPQYEPYTLYIEPQPPKAPTMPHNYLIAGGIKVTYELITPDYATEILANNTHNRRTSPAQIRKLAALHGTEFWKQTGDSIRIAADGTLIDGQHRLNAILMSGIAVHYFIMRGVELEAQQAIDTGTRRTLAAMLQTRNEKNITSLGSATKAIYAWEVLGSRKADGFEAADTGILLKYFDENRDHLVAAASISKRTTNIIKGGATVFAIAYNAFSKINDPFIQEDITYFFNRLNSDFDHTEGDPISTLRKQLIADHNEALGNQASKHGQNWRLAITIKAWNAYRQNRSVKMLGYRTGGANPETMPDAV